MTTLERRSLLREVNERIRSLNAAFESVSARYDVFCECGSSDCLQRVEVPGHVYDDVRSDRHRFLVRPGHERPEHDRVLAEEWAYRVIA